jgi:hypothetical protein
MINRPKKRQNGSGRSTQQTSPLRLFAILLIASSPQGEREDGWILVIGSPPCQHQDSRLPTSNRDETNFANDKTTRRVFPRFLNSSDLLSSGSSERKRIIMSASLPEHAHRIASHGFYGTSIINYDRLPRYIHDPHTPQGDRNFLQLCSIAFLAILKMLTVLGETERVARIR